MDRDFHVTAEVWNRFGCTVCGPAEEADGESSDYDYDTQGFSLCQTRATDHQKTSLHALLSKKDGTNGKITLKNFVGICPAVCQLLPHHLSIEDESLKS